MTPARIPYQNDLIEEVVRREGFGADDVPDLLYINYKLTDEIGHTDSMNSVEMSDAVRATDAGLRELVGILNATVGEGEWVMAVTADHGHTPDPEVSGAYVISPTAVADVTNAAFDLDGDDVRVVEYTQPTEVFINTDELAEQGYTLNDRLGVLDGAHVPRHRVADVAGPRGGAGRTRRSWRRIRRVCWTRLDCVPRDEPTG